MTVCYFNDWLHKYFVILLLLKNYILTDENMNDALRSVNYLLIDVLASSSVKTRRRNNRINSFFIWIFKCWVFLF